jgi:hypothetical protein
MSNSKEELQELIYKLMGVLTILAGMAIFIVAYKAFLWVISF